MKLFCDGGHNKDGTYGSFRIEDEMGRLITFEEKIIFDVATNNEAEYEALRQGLHRCIDFETKQITVYSDSLLMISQLNRDWKINVDRLREFAEKIWALLENFDIYTLNHVRRDVIVGKLGH